ncbi:MULTISPECIES: hypothetical protein [unclassified Bradyrhizobium]|uniref:hypothetical protein n=1 Tax=unclassified Bradyrhizobium TaxID=2631580 RepID=UPI00247858A3|nr:MULTISPECIES: hypothetical protein [unclassified Bradyrhizobium]WGS22995.1 hypothetical protein MTX22_15925 [Bradyrhizobium sp. ISRA463]WGS29995.1 hypothetical protein MTX19_13655 [Bradyrhizobium sp. ISRA464]
MPIAAPLLVFSCRSTPSNAASFVRLERAEQTTSSRPCGAGGSGAWPSKRMTESSSEAPAKYGINGSAACSSSVAAFIPAALFSRREDTQEMV